MEPSLCGWAAERGTRLSIGFGRKYADQVKSQEEGYYGTTGYKETGNKAGGQKYHSGEKRWHQR
ncbi:hypothetical protein D3C74_483680 [compost metagenome]